MLEDGVDAAFVGRKRIEASAGHPDFAGGGLFETGDEAEKSGLSGTAFAEQGEEFSGGDPEGNIFENFAATELFGDVAQFEERIDGRGRQRRAGRNGGHWAALTSFQISMYWARRGTSCQK